MKPDAPAFGRNNLIVDTLWTVLRRHRRAALIAAVFLVLAKVASVGVPLVLKRIVDEFTISEGARNAALAGSPPAVAPLVAVPVFLLIGYSLLRFSSTLFVELRDMSFVRVTLDSITGTAERALLHLLQLGPRLHAHRNSGSMLHDVNRGTAAVGFLLGAALFTLLPTLVEIGGVLVVMIAGYSLWFTAIILATFGVYAFYTFAMTRQRVAFERQVNALGARAEGSLLDSLLNYEAVKVNVRERHEVRRYASLLGQWSELSVHSQYALSRLHLGQGAIIAAGVGAIMLLAGDYTMHGAMTVGDLVLVNAYVLQICMPLNALGFLFRETRDAMVDIDRLSVLLRQPVEPAEDPPHRALLDDRHRPTVGFEDVAFAYEPGRPILQGVSFVIPAGSTTAVVGGSGSGKSTLARLLLRLYEVDGGRITVDGTDVRRIGLPSLRASIGMVPQDTVLFNDTIAYNIAYGRPGATQADVVEAARAAQLHELILSLPQQYETAVGERGLMLSGGERQRLAIARALLKDPPILVFDEATSALDTRAERAIQGEIDRIAKDRTTLIIAHRLSTIVGADEIIVLDRGRIVERGRHDELLGRGGLYAQLWHLQQQQLDVERTERRLARQPLNVAALLAGVLDGVRSIVEERSIQIFTDIELEQARITGDPSALSQALWDLCLHALNATPDGGRIEWALGRHQGSVRLTLTDGVSSDAERAPAPGGSVSADPLQLRSVFERHGGQFRIEPPGTTHGTRYVVELPLRAIDPVDVAPPLAEEASVPARQRLAGACILAIDDLADAREMLQIALEHEGAKVVPFARGDEALDWLAALAPARWPQVLVCDIALEDEDGHDVVRRLRHMEARLGLGLEHRLPAIALTGLARPEDRLRALMAGFQVHLAKPVQIQELVATIRRLIRHDAAAPAAGHAPPAIEPSQEEPR